MRRYHNLMYVYKKSKGPSFSFISNSMKMTIIYIRYFKEKFIFEYTSNLVNIYL